MARVLIVEDVDEIADLYRNAMEGVGLEVSRARSSTEAIDIFLTDRPQAVLMDVALTRSSGITATLALRGLGFAGPVVLVTGGLVPVNPEAMRLCGFSAILAKADTLPTDLAAEVKRQLEML